MYQSWGQQLRAFSVSPKVAISCPHGSDFALHLCRFYSFLPPKGQVTFCLAEHLRSLLSISSAQVGWREGTGDRMKKSWVRRSYVKSHSQDFIAQKAKHQAVNVGSTSPTSFKFLPQRKLVYSITKYYLFPSNFYTTCFCNLAFQMLTYT